MIIFAFILYIFFVVLLGASALLYLSPILIGLTSIVIANAISKIKRGKMAPVIWHVITIAVTIFSTGMLWKDIWEETVDTGPLPFIILVIYGIISIAILGLPEPSRRTKPRREVIALEDLSEKTQKRIQTSRVVAIICTVMVGVGIIIVATESANISESLPPTILFGIVAIICWAIAGRKHYQFCTKADDEQVPEAFSRAAKDEYREILGEEPPRGYVKAVYEEYQEWDEDLRRGLRKGASGKVYDWKLKETWEDYPAPNYDEVHTYCEIAFDDSGRTYYYRTRNPELQVGDTVYVPYGNKTPKKIGVIITMEDYAGYEVPFPLEKTKYIIGKVK